MKSVLIIIGAIILVGFAIFYFYTTHGRAVVMNDIMNLTATSRKDPIAVHFDGMPKLRRVVDVK